MTIITKLSFLLLLTLLALILPSHCHTKPDEREESPEEWLGKCFARCGKQPNQQWQTECQKKCVEEYDQRSQQREQRGRGGSEGNDDRRDPDKQLRECLSRCEWPERGEEKQDCQQRCQRQYQEQREQGRGHGGGSGTNEGERGEQGTQGQREGENPYYFHSSQFKSRYKSQEGDIRVLGRFNKRSDLLRGVENNRLRLLVANPQTVILPHHNDASSVFVVLSGERSFIFFPISTIQLKFRDF